MVAVSTPALVGFPHHKAGGKHYHEPKHVHR